MPPYSLSVNQSVWMTTVSGHVPFSERAAPDAFGAGALLSVDRCRC
jgi:hypothetical protein